MIVSHLQRKRHRKGVILLVVISLLTLFAVVGLSFVLYAEGSANSARIWREARQKADAVDSFPPLSDDSINKIMGDLIYDVDDKGNPQTVGSMYYGQGMARAMYGWNSLQPNGTNINTVPYGGIGLIPNDPNMLDCRYAGNTIGRRPEIIPGMTPTYFPKNADYTYPDLKDFYLAAVSAKDGRVLVPSFHRPGLIDYDPANAANPNYYTNPATRFRTPRPHIIDHPNFPLPNRNLDGTYGDVVLDVFDWLMARRDAALPIGSSCRLFGTMDPETRSG